MNHMGYSNRDIMELLKRVDKKLDTLLTKPPTKRQSKADSFKTLRVLEAQIPELQQQLVEMRGRFGLENKHGREEYPEEYKKYLQLRKLIDRKRQELAQL